MVQTKEERAIYQKTYYLKNKEKICLQKKIYNLENKEERAIYERKKYLKNKDKISIKSKEYRLENREKITENRLSNHKKITIDSWKRQGLKSEIYGAIYDYYNGVLNCERCGVTLTTGERCKTQKHMDHCHQTGLFRNVVCMSCNSSLPKQTEFNPCKPFANTLEVVKEV
tara:strand:+ start:3742 stop:4251 length:510 start_codon:yes stop_codon:yes gene_type:complete